MHVVKTMKGLEIDLARLRQHLIVGANASVSSSTREARGKRRSAMWRTMTLTRLAAADWRRSESLAGSSLRRWLVAASLVAGLVLALATVHLAAPWHAFAGLDDG